LTSKKSIETPPSEDSNIWSLIIDEYNLLVLTHDGRVYIKIQKGIYCLPQEGIIANELLRRRLALHWYHPTKHMHGLWKHEICPVWFSLVVGDFGIKCVGRKNTKHLITAIKKKYEISSD
jgi:hypothetical protein